MDKTVLSSLHCYGAFAINQVTICVWVGGVMKFVIHVIVLMSLYILINFCICWYCRLETFHYDYGIGYSSFSVLTVFKTSH